MLLNLTELIYKHGLKIRGAIVVGAHHFTEEQEYRRNGINDFILIEPASAALEVLLSKFRDDSSIKIFNNACGAFIDEKIKLFTEKNNNGQSNSLLRPKNHLTQYESITFEGEEEVSVVPLDFISFRRNDFNFLSMDVQCFEMEVLKGAKETLKTIDYIMSEVNKPGAELYEGCTDIDQMDAFLSEFGFVRVEEPKWIGGTWSDSLWVKK
jgi:FkbM family methyltransferase